MNRRAALKTLGTAAGAFLLDGCMRRGSQVVPGHPPELLHLPRVDVRPELEIRTVVGLRPFRPSGFVVRAENVGDKLVVHNYGHGGGGVTLSWGTSELAARLVREASGARVAVLGSGAVGLATSRLLQERGYSVTIYAKDLPPNTTSNTAGAQWYPFLVYEREHATPAFMQQFVEAAGIANRRFQLMVGERYGVRWIPNFYCSPDPYTSGRFAPGNPLHQFLVDVTAIEGPSNPFPLPYVRRVQTMMIEPSIYLPALMSDFFVAGGKIVVQEFHSLADVAQLSESTVVNCTGLGAHALFGDQELTAVKGQLTVLMPQPAVNYAAHFGDDYMFPRRDGVLLGGTHERDVWTLDPNPDAKQRVLAEHQQFFSGMKA
ncbi:MAG: FAD-dependent oxidoreductase [Deltaproteobacteria bacterium]|nr:MAG: FAD-dependent oxidoreductase [Deltaproteobacteria bacterium]